MPKENTQPNIASTLGGIQSVPYHIHNGVDSPLLRKVSYAGITGGRLGPYGWTITQNSTDSWTVTHNLGTTKYSVALGVQNSNSTFTAVVTARNSNNFTVGTFTGNAGTDFCFILQLLS